MAEELIKRGRPRKENIKVTISLNEKLKEVVTHKAKLLNLTRSEYIEQALLEKIRNEKIEG